MADAVDELLPLKRFPDIVDVAGVEDATDRVGLASVVF